MVDINAKHHTLKHLEGSRRIISWLWVGKHFFTRTEKTNRKGKLLKNEESIFIKVSLDSEMANQRVEEGIYNTLN